MIRGSAAAVNSRTRLLWSDRCSLATKDIWHRPASLANLATTITSTGRRNVMFEELTEELLDLSANVRGYGSAVYAVVDDTSCSSGLCSSVILCCTCTTLCW
jgi:hypothetical protein